MKQPKTPKSRANHSNVVSIRLCLTASISTGAILQMLPIAEAGPAGPSAKLLDIATIPTVSIKLPINPNQKA